MILPKVCFGTHGIGEGLVDRDNYFKYKEALEYALMEGIRFFDTAENYAEGRAENLLGEAIKDIRKDVIIATKIAPENTISRWAIEEAINGSLRRLGTDYIDIYQVHWPHPRHDVDLIIHVFREAIEAGKILKVGLCNHSISQGMIYDKYLGDDFISIQDEFNLVDNTSLSQCLPNKYFLAYSTLRHKIMTLRVSKFIKVLKKKYNLTYHQVILSWVASFDKYIPIFTSFNINHIKENLAVFSASTSKLEKIDISMLTQASSTHVKWLDTSLMRPFEIDQKYCPTPEDLQVYIKEGISLKPIKVSRNNDATYTVEEGKVRFLAYKETGRVPAIILGD